MDAETILSHRPKVLSDKQREDYFQNGYVLLEAIVPRERIEQLLGVTAQFVEKSRGITQSDTVFDLDKGHSADAPRLRRLSSPVDQHAAYWAFASSDLMADVAEDLVGPDVKFHHSKLNFKWAGAGQEVKWHQDIQFWPHTDYSPMTMGIYLHDTDLEMGPLQVIPGSHAGELYDQFAADGTWVGYILDRDIGRVDTAAADTLMGPAGSLTIHNCRTVHASQPNLSPVGRPLLLHTYSSADSFPYTPNPIPSPHSGEVIRGRRARWAHHDPRPCVVPPDWSKGYGSIFTHQEKQAM